MLLHLEKKLYIHVLSIIHTRTSLKMYTTANSFTKISCKYITKNTFSDKIIKTDTLYKNSD